MKAGTELDLLVAEKVMGYERRGLMGGVLQGEHGETLPYCPKYSVDSDQALRVLDRLTRIWSTFSIDWDAEDGVWVIHDPKKNLVAVEQSFQVAVCNAALRAVGVWK